MCVHSVELFPRILRSRACGEVQEPVNLTLTKRPQILLKILRKSKIRENTKSSEQSSSSSAAAWLTYRSYAAASAGLAHPVIAALATRHGRRKEGKYRTDILQAEQRCFPTHRSYRQRTDQTVLFKSSGSAINWLRQHAARRWRPMGTGDHGMGTR